MPRSPGRPTRDPGGSAASRSPQELTVEGLRWVEFGVRGEHGESALKGKEVLEVKNGRKEQHAGPLFLGTSVNPGENRKGTSAEALL